MVGIAPMVQKPRPIGLAWRYCVVDYRLPASQDLRSEGIEEGTTSLKSQIFGSYKSKYFSDYHSVRTSISIIGQLLSLFMI
jgi:hypothetical protein